MATLAKLHYESNSTSPPVGAPSRHSATVVIFYSTMGVKEQTAALAQPGLIDLASAADQDEEL
jgi:hypothetical protein